MIPAVPTFGLASLALLQRYLIEPRLLLLWLSLGTLFLSIASKELGHIGMPIAIGLIWHERRRLCRRNVLLCDPWRIDVYF